MSSKETRLEQVKRFTPESIRDLRSRFHGILLQPGDQAYNIARRVWNGMIDRYPSLIAQCRDEDDVVNAINFARAHQVPVAVRGGGHNVAGFASVNDGLVIDLSPMRHIDVDANGRAAQAQPGATWGEFDHATLAYNLVTTGSLVSTTGIAGFTLGGGIGWLVRKLGLALDNLISARVISAKGERLNASAAENPDLFWGLRGGGGNFGVVTRFNYTLHPLSPSILGGALYYRLNKFHDVLQFYRRWAPGLPDELTTMAVFLTVPENYGFPLELVGSHLGAIAMCYAGPIERGETLVHSLRREILPDYDAVGPTSYNTLQGMFNYTAPDGIFSHWKTEYLNEINDAAIDTLISYANRVTSPLSAVYLHHVEGKVARSEPGQTAFTHRNARYLMNILGAWHHDHEPERHIAWVRDLARDIHPYSTGEVFLNFLGDEGEQGVKAAYDPAAYDRLAHLKQHFDPSNLFQINHNIRPATNGVK